MQPRKSNLIYSLTLFLAFFTVGAQATIQKASLWQIFKQRAIAARDVVLDMYGPTNFCGIHAPCAEVEKEIREVLEKIGVGDVASIQIKRFSTIAKRVMGEKNAFVWQFPGCPRYLFVSEEWYLTLPKNVREFLIAHEGMHLKCNHAPKKLKCLSGMLGGTIVVGALAALGIKKYNLTEKPLVAFSVAYGSVIISMVYLQKTLLQLSRNHEFEADAQAAKALGTSLGGQALCDIFQKEEDFIESELPQRPFLINARKDLRQRATHPTNSDRKVALANLAL